MQFSRSSAELFVPDGCSIGEALARTTRLAVSAHPDDVEIMAIEGILSCFGHHQSRWFSAVVVGDGATGPREGEYDSFTDQQMRDLRRKEQKKAAVVGEYSVQILLDHSSNAIRDGDAGIVDDLTALLSEMRLSTLYTHNLADAHDTHVAVCLRVIEACRRLPRDLRPERLVGCEVWRDLDWLPDARKLRMHVDEREHLQAALIGVFDSQIAGGKRYDRAALGRRSAHATFSNARTSDTCSGIVLGMDLTPLLLDEEVDPVDYAVTMAREFESDLAARLDRVSKPRESSSR